MRIHRSELRRIESNFKKKMMVEEKQTKLVSGKEKKALVGRSSCPRVDEIMRTTSHVIISVVYV